MIETWRLKNVVIFIQTDLRFVLSRKIINIYNDTAQKYGNVTVKVFLKIWKTRVQKEQTVIRHRLPQQLQTTWRVSEIHYL